MTLIAGVDEVGRGPLAGPVVAAAVVFQGKPGIRGLKDSKKLNESNRIILSSLIKQKSICWAIGIVSVKEIDRLNIHHASLLAMKRALESLSVRPDFALIDGNKCPDVDLPMEAIVGGDDIVPCISAASIVAKVCRDHLMTLFDKNYPQYKFSQHKGYCTNIHLQALKKHGVTKLHRQSFGPVKELLQVK